MSLICINCGCQRDLEELRASGSLSCCPERKVVEAAGLVRALEQIRDILSATVQGRGTEVFHIASTALLGRDQL